MGFFRLLKGELNKILMRPILYVITAVLVLATIFANFQFNPQTKNNYSDYFGKYSGMTSLVKVNQQFNAATATNSYGYLAANSLITQATNELETAKANGEKTEPGERTTVEYLYYLFGIHQKDVSEYENFISAYNNYMSDQLNREDSIDGYIESLANLVGSIKPSKSDDVVNPDPAYERNNLVAIHDYITKVSDIEKTRKKDTQFANNGILISEEKITKFNEAYLTIYNNIISENRPSIYDIRKSENHKSIRNLIAESNIYFLLKDVIESIQIKSISEKTYTSLSENISYSKTYLSTLKGEIEEFVATQSDKKVDELTRMCVKYYIYALNTLALVQDVTKYDSVLKFDDKYVNTLFGYNTMNIDGTPRNGLYLYAIQEKIAKENYMLHNKTTSLDYSSVFNGSNTSGSVVNAFDYVYFGLEITSIVIIIFTVVLAASMLAGEQSTGTLKLLLIRPYSRSSILTSKLLATIIFALIFFVFSTVVLFLIGWARFGVSFAPVLAVFNGTSAFAISPVLLLLIYLLCLLLKAVVFIAISLAISAIFRSNVGAVSISIVLYFIISIMGTIFAQSYIYGFIPLSNLDLFKFFGGSFTSGQSTSLLTSIFSSSIFHSVGFYYSLGVNIAVIAIIIICAYLIFRKREVK